MRALLAILIVITIALGVVFAMRAIPVVRLTLKIQKIKRELGRFSRYWHRIERKFISDEQFRESFTEDPSKLSGYFKIVDYLEHTDFCNGLTSDELSGLFLANPDVQASRVEEYLCYRKMVKI